MKRFVWRLQQVLEVKKQEEQIKRGELLKITERLAAKRGQLLTAKRILKDVIMGIAGERPGKRLSKQEFFLSHSSASDEWIKKLEEQAHALELQQREKVREVLKLRRLKEGLEKLREAAKREFIRYQEKLEQKELDEMARIRFSRKGTSNFGSPVIAVREANK